MESKGTLQLAILEMLAACTFHCISHTTFKYGDYPMFQVLFVRGAFTIIVVFFISPLSDLYKKSKIQKIILSQFLVTIATVTFFQSVKMIPIGETTLIYQTNTLWAQFIFRLFHNEPISYSRIRNTLQCIFGIYLILDFNLETQDATQHLIGGLLSLFTSICYGFIYLVVNQIGKTVSAFALIVHFHLQMEIACGLGQIYYEQNTTQPGVYVLAAVMTVFSLMAHYFQYKATLAVPYNKLSVYTYSQPVVAMGMDYFVFGKMTPIKSLIGGSIVLLSISLQLSEDQKSQKEQQKSESQKLNEPTEAILEQSQKK